jgi:hypothetical protein
MEKINYHENFLLKYLFTFTIPDSLLLFEGNKNLGSPNVCHHTKKCSNGNAHTRIGIWWWYLPQISAH